MLSFLPASDLDPFADDVLADPYPSYRRLRDAGPAVWLRRHDMWALPRYAEVRWALRDWETFSSASGVGVTADFNDLRGGILSSDPPEHNRLRRPLHRQLAPRVLRGIEDDLQERADTLVGPLVDRGSFDAVRDLAQPYSASVVADLVGLPQERRSELLANSDAAFNRFGPDNRRYRDAESGFRRLLDYVTTVAVPGRIAPGGWGAALYEAAATGEVDPRECARLMLVYTWPSMDTTVAAVSSAVQRFARHPESWDLVRREPDLVPAALDEVLRIDSPAQFLTRLTTREVDVAGTALPAGTRVMVMIGSANRDERRYPEPDHFDVRRNPTDHLAFGHGTHHCVGAPLARMEAHAVIRALARRVARFTLLDERPHLNNAIRGPEVVRVAVERAEEATRE